MFGSRRYRFVSELISASVLNFCNTARSSAVIVSGGRACGEHRVELAERVDRGEDQVTGGPGMPGRHLIHAPMLAFGIDRAAIAL